MNGYLYLSAAVALLFFVNGIEIRSAEAQVFTGEWVTSERSPNADLWQRTSIVTDAVGNESTRTNFVTVLTTGKNRWDEATKSFVPASEELEIVNGAAVGQKTQHKVVFAGNIADPAGTVDLLTTDGLRMRSQIVGVAYSQRDTGKSVFISELQVVGGIVDGLNMVWYDGCLSNMDASVRYRHTLAGIEQDVVFYEKLPPPEIFGINPGEGDVYLEIWTHFLESPDPLIEEGTIPRLGEKGEFDQTLIFGDMRIAHGKGFVVGEDENGSGIGIAKAWVQIGQERFLIESVPLADVEPFFSLLPEPPQVRLDLERNKESIEEIFKKQRLMARSGRVKPLSLASVPKNPLDEKIVLARAGAPAPRKLGFLLDYSTTTSTNNYTFRSDETYFISGAVALTGTTTFEGGTVIKYDNTPTTKISIQGPITVLTDTHRTITMTAKHDNTIGESVAAGTPSGYYANPALVLNGNNSAYGYSLQNFRILYANLGVEATYNGTYGGYTFKHFQLGNSHKGFRFAYVEADLYNGLMFNVATNFYDTYYTTNTLQNVTCDSAAYFQHTTTSSYFSLKNCLLTAVSNQGSWGSGGGNESLSSSSGVYQSVGGGNYYLASGSSYRNAGVSTIDTTLAAELKERTTYPPVLKESLTITNNLLLFPQAGRDTDTVDVGFHYAPSDYLFRACMISNATVEAKPGTVIGVIPVGTSHGLSVAQGAAIHIRGKPNLLSKVVHYGLFQEQFTSGWASTTESTAIRKYPNVSGSPSLKIAYDFCELVMPGGFGYHYYEEPGDLSGPVSATSSFFSGGKITGNGAFLATNCFFSRVDFYFDTYDWEPVELRFRNNTFWRGNLFLQHYDQNEKEFYNNHFDQAAITLLNQAPAHDYNAFQSGYNTLSTLGSNEFQYSNAFVYATGAFGDFYNSSTNLVNRGSTNANYLGFSQYTTQTSDTKEGTTMVDLGFHYIAADANDEPNDADSDGVPDYLEDVNGNNAVDPGETSGSNGDDLGFKIIITTPKQNSILP